MVLAALGHMAHFMRDQAAYGVEMLVGVAGREQAVEGFVDALDAGVTTDAVGLVGQAEDVAFVVVDVEFVLDLADDFFQHVFNGDQAGDSAELVDHDGLVVAVATELAQQVVELLALGHEDGRAQQGADVQRRRALELEQVFGKQNADDVLALLAVDRKARVPGFDHQVQLLVKRRVDVDQVHARRGHHDIARCHVGQTDHAVEHDPGFGVDDLVVLGLGQRFGQFLARIGSRADEFDEFLQQTAPVRLLGARVVAVAVAVVRAGRLGI